ncbi:hypothetical protein [Streptomyces sp. NPDC047868]|uniref:hypothetical protein n=1 Tax=Streptomyces sp. NPDC047868 TaxID=3155480 RepID=UPI003456DB6E
MPLQRLTEDERLAFCAWFAANGVDPDTVPQHTDLTIDVQDDGIRVIHYDEYVLTEDGSKQIHPKDPTISWTRPATTACLVEPPAWLINPYVRLRRLPVDPRLYVTHDGRTESGYLTEARAESTDLIISLSSSDPALYGDTTPDAIRIPGRRILRDDVSELGRYLANDERDTGRPDHPTRQLINALDQLTAHLTDAVPPPCGHEDVIETPEFGDVTTRGICVWCPTPLLQLNGEWIPA